MKQIVVAIAVVACAGIACTELDRREPVSEVHVVYDPQNAKIPLPNDLALDTKAGHLNLPIPADATPAEAEFRAFMNTHDAWPTTFPLQAELSGTIDPKSLTKDAIGVYEWSGQGLARVEDATVTLDGSTINVDAPVTGWKRGAKYAVAILGGRYGLRDGTGRPVGCDETFWFLRQRERLDTDENQSAFPGDTREARMEIAQKLEAIRAGLAPVFDALEKQKVAREDVAALWTYTITTATELAMDAPSQRVPLPFDPLIDPKTGLIHLPPSTRDSARDATAKLQLNKTNGFSVSGALAFELTQAVDPATAADGVRVYQLGAGAPRAVQIAKVDVLPSEGAAPCTELPVADVCTHVMVTLAETELPLAPKTTYAVVVDDRLKPRDGGVLRPMIMGHFLRAKSPIVIDGKSQVAELPLDKAALLEATRAKVDPLLRTVDRAHVIAAWSFTTMDAAPGLRDAMKLPDVASYDPTPIVTSHKDIKPGALGAADQSEIDAFQSLFPGVATQIVGTVYAPRIRGVRQIVEGTIASPYTLDRTTRGARADGGYDREDVHFVLALPDKPASPGMKVPVMMFGHGLVTDRRFVLTVAGALAQKGIASIAFDFPFHGERTKCTSSSLLGLPNPFPQAIRNLDPHLQSNILSLAPCPSGATCSADGRCLAADGSDAGYAMIPLTGMPVAGGSALIDVNDIPHISDRMRQAVIDMAAVRRAIRLADWTPFTEGVALDPQRIYYSGQSLGGILGAVYVSLADDVERAVLNVPGADEVDLFNQSTVFGPQMQDFFDREKLVDGSYERARLVAAAHWLIDTVDPQALAPLLATRPAYMQMDTGDIVIPNFVTQRLQRATLLPMKAYPSPLHGDLVVPVVGDTMLGDLVDFLVNAKAAH